MHFSPQRTGSPIPNFAGSQSGFGRFISNPSLLAEKSGSPKASQSGICEFDTCHSSQPLAQLEIASTLCAKTQHF
jgi:hypothetical protein